jgi:sulfate permease, SulP family
MWQFVRARYFSNIRGDIYGGLTAAVVALPLALAFGVASGLGPIAGLYGAILTGFFAAIFGGTPSQVTGPTGPMTVVMATIVATHANNLPEAFAIVILGGALQLVFGIARLGRYIAYTPYSVVSGFMTGIGCIIMIIQIMPFLGIPEAGGGTVGALRALVTVDSAAVVWGAVGLGALSLCICIFWPGRLRRLLPAPLAALVVCTLISVFFLPNVPVIGEVARALPKMHVPVFNLEDAAGIVNAGFVLAILACIDSLLTSLVADSLTRTQHNADQELLGQGLGNMIAGLFGALPGAGATMRTVVNIRSGGRTRLSGAIHALALLAVALGLGPLAGKIPLAVLAGILVKVGWDIIDWKYVTRLHRVPREKAAVMLITLGLTVFVDLITAVGVGIILAFFVNARALEVVQLKGLRHASGQGEDETFLSEDERARLRQANGQILISRLSGTFSYASARELVRRAGSRLGNIKVIIYDFSDTAYMDPSAAQSVDALFDQAISSGVTVMVTGLQGEIEKALKSFSVLDRVPEANRFKTHGEAIDSALAKLAAAN